MIAIAILDVAGGSLEYHAKERGLITAERDGDISHPQHHHP